MPFPLNDIYAFLAKGDLWSWLSTLGLALGLTVVVRLAISFVAASLRKLSSRTPFVWDDVAVNVLASTRGWVIFVLLFNALEPLMTISARADRVTDVLAVMAMAMQIIFWGFGIISGWHQTYLETRVQRDASSAAALGLLYTAMRAGFVVIVLLSALNNLGVDVHALVAGLGVGSLAIGLAAQNILQDLLASFSIVLDKPFVVGDFIVVGNLNGTVENIGIKTTRVRALSGEQIVFSNKNLLDSRVQNFKSLWQRRVVQKFSVAYSTPREKLREVPVWIRALVEADQRLKFDRCHLAFLGDLSLDFELVYLVLDPDYNLYMDRQQQLFLDVLERFAAENIELAVPTKSVTITKPAET